MVYVVAEKRERVLMRLGDDRHLGYGDPDVVIGPRVSPLTIMHLSGESDIERQYVADHTVRKTHRAVKLLSPQLTENACLVRRFVKRGASSGTGDPMTSSARIDPGPRRGKARNLLRDRVPRTGSSLGGRVPLRGISARGGVS